MNDTIPARRCLTCDALQPIGHNEAVWPLNWTCPSCHKSVPERNGISLFAPEFADKVAGMSEQSYRFFERLENNHFWFARRKALIVGLAEKYFPSAQNYLEVGCGSGGVLEALKSSRPWKRVAASELHLSGIVIARRRLPAEVEFVQMDARNIPAAQAFDLTGAFDVIEHIAEDERVLSQMRAATRLGGGAIVAVPQHPWLWSKTDEISYHERRYERGELERKMRRASFEIVFSSSFTALLLPLMAASRAMGGGKQDAANDGAELAIGSKMNRLLSAVLRAENRLTLAGVSWPAGGSRIVVGRAV